MRRVLVLIVLGALLVTAGALGAGTAERGSGPVARVDAAGVGRGDLATVIRALEARVDAQPRDGRAFASLGHLYVEQSRATGDLSYYARADRALERALALGDAEDLALSGKAALAAARHDFSGALRFADAAVRLDAYQATALAIRVDALTELGRYHAQWAAAQQANRRSPGPPVLARLSYTHELRGRLGPARALLRQALSGTVTPTDRAFLLTLQADLARKAGELATAARHLRAAHRAAPAYAPAYSSRARLALARGDLARAERIWKQEFARNGSTDAAHELARLYLLQGRSDLADPLFRSLAETRAREIAAGVDMDLEIAQFEADHGSPARALAAARREWGRRHSVHVADALAWALRANGRPAEALRYAVRATRLGTPDATFWLHRAAIEADLGLSIADAHLGKAVLLDPGVSPWLVAQARTALRGTGP